MARTDAVVHKGTEKALAERPGLANPLSTFRQEMDKLVENFFGGFDFHPFGRRSVTFMPQVDVADTDKEIKVSVELPGLDDKDVEVSLTKETLTIKGEKKEEKEEKEKNWTHREVRYGSFSRGLTLPCAVDVNKIDAECKKGVLKITLAKVEGEKSRKISVKPE